MKLSAEAMRAAGLGAEMITQVMVAHEVFYSSKTRAQGRDRAVTYRARNKADADVPEGKGRRSRWPGHTMVPGPWVTIAKQAGRSDQEIAYAFERFRNDCEANGRMYVRWEAAWRNCVGRTGWAFRHREKGNGKQSVFAERAQRWDEAVDQLSNGHGAYPRAGEPAGGAVRQSDRGERSPDLFDFDHGGPAALPGDGG